VFKTEAEARAAFHKQHGEQPTKFELAYAMRTGLVTGAAGQRQARAEAATPPQPSRPAPLPPPKTTQMIADGPLSPEAAQNAINLFNSAKKTCVIHGLYFGELCPTCLDPDFQEGLPPQSNDPLDPYSSVTSAELRAAAGIAPLDTAPGIVYHEPVTLTQPTTTQKEIPMAPPTATAAPIPSAKPAPAGLMASRATKRMGRIRAAVSAPSGGGKTYGALLLAKGFIGKEVYRDVSGTPTPKVIVVDTEAYSSADYGADGAGKYPIIPFDIIDMTPPYTVLKYIEAYQYAADNGYEVVIFDSLSHAWKGDGGMLDSKAKLDARGGGKFSNWQIIDQDWSAFRAMILHSKIHLIGTMRSKTEYLVDASGRPTKIGLGNEMRDGLEFDFTIVFDLDMKHNAEVTKHRTLKLFEGRGLFPLTDKVGAELMNWRMSGAEEAPRPEPAAVDAPKPVAAVPLAQPAVQQPAAATATSVATPASMNVDQTTKIKELCEQLKITTAHAKQEIAGVPKGTLLTFDGANDLIKTLEAKLNGPGGLEEEES
jgi:hypothetical protein